MSRSGYTDDWDYGEGQWMMIRWRGAVKSAIRGKRGQTTLKAILDAMDALPVKRLIQNDLQSKTGEFCTLGVLGNARGVDMTSLDPDNREGVAAAFDVAPALAAEIFYENDEARWNNETPELRFARMRRWVASNIRPQLETPQ